MGQITTSQRALSVRRKIEYPESDGKPMGETSFHIKAILYLLSALQYYFRDAADVYVGSNLLMYYDKRERNVFVVPDVFVAKGTHKQDRRVWKTWEDGVPVVVFEITSRSTRLEDIATKRGLYELLGVQEYILFDPLDEYLRPRLQGFRLRGDEYERVALTPKGDLMSAELKLLLRPEGKLLRAVDPKTNQVIPTLDEAMWIAEKEKKRAEREARRAAKEAERAQAETERAQAETERARAETERANRAEQELERLRAENERLRRATDG